MFLFTSGARAQSKKIDAILGVSSRAVMLLNEYTIGSAVHSGNFFGAAAGAGSNTLISLTGQRKPGSTAELLNINFVHGSSWYPKPEYITETKTI